MRRKHPTVPRKIRLPASDMQPPDINPAKPAQHKPPESEGVSPPSAGPAPPTRQPLIDRFLVTGTIVSGFCLLLTVAVPEDPTVTWRMGFSRGRLALVVLLSLVSLILLALAIQSRRSYPDIMPPLSRLAIQTSGGRSGPVLLGLAGLGLFGSLYFLINGLNLPNFWQQPAQVRLAPFMLWVVLLSILSLNLMYGLGTRLRIPAYLQGSKGFILSYGLFSLAIFVLSVCLYLTKPGLDNAFIDEDAVVENLTAALFLWTGLIGGLVYRQNTRRVRVWLAIPVLAIWAFVEEISFGERIFDLDMPYLGGEKFDGVHDLFFLAYEGLRIRGALPWTLIGLLLLAFGVWRLSPGLHLTVQQIYRTVMTQPALIFLSLATGFIASSLILDLEFLAYPTSSFLEELIELIGALALSFAALAMGWVVNDGEGQDA